VVSTDCAARRCRPGHAPSGIAIATITSLCYRPLEEVYTVPVLLVIRSSPGDELTDLLNSGVSVRAYVRPYVHSFFRFFF